VADLKFYLPIATCVGAIENAGAQFDFGFALRNARAVDFGGETRLAGNGGGWQQSSAGKGGGKRAFHGFLPPSFKVDRD
jgi:hypothetical protein